MDKPFENTAAPRFLRQARRVADLGQTEVAQELGYETSQFISNWERGISLPPPHAINTLARVYEVDRDELILVIVAAYTLAAEQKARALYV